MGSQHHNALRQRVNLSSMHTYSPYIPADHEFRRALGAAVAARRVSLGIGQRPFARMAGIETNHLRSIEAGGTDLKLSTMRKLASALDMQLSALFEEAEGIAKSADRSASEDPRPPC